MSLPLPVWDGTQAGMQYILDRISLALPSSGVPMGQMVAVAASSLAAPTATTAWTTLDVSALVPAAALQAVLLIDVAGVRAASSGSYARNTVDVRRDANSQIAGRVAFGFANPTTTASVGGAVCGQVVVPLSNRTFQYQYTVALNGSNNASIQLAGYMI